MTVSTGVNARSYQLVDVDSDDLVPDDAAGVLDMRPVGKPAPRLHEQLKRPVGRARRPVVDHVLPALVVRTVAGSAAHPLLAKERLYPLPEFVAELLLVKITASRRTRHDQHAL